MRKVDPGRPLTKAIPLSLTELRRILIAAPLPIRALAILAFRSASRISDLLHLRPKDVTTTKDGLLVSFSITKTNQEAERRADHRILEPWDTSIILVVVRSLCFLLLRWRTFAACTTFLAGSVGVNREAPASFRASPAHPPASRRAGLPALMML